MASMSLKSTVRAAIAAVAGGCLLLIALTSTAYVTLKTNEDNSSYARSVNANIAKLSFIISELVMRPSARAFWQLKRQYEILSAQLGDPPHFKSRADTIVVELSRRAITMKGLLDYLESSAGSSQQMYGFSQEAREILFASLITQSGALHSRSQEMREIIFRDATNVQRTIFTALGLVFITIIILGGMSMSLLCHRLVARILQLRAVIQEIGGGKLDVDIPPPTPDEMGDVFRELDQMRLSLVKSIGELGRVNLELIGSKAELEDRVAERTAGLKTANQELEFFTYAVSHDLRAPLRSMSGFSQAVLEDYGDKLDDEGRAMLKRVTRATGHMSQLIDDLLKISRIDRSPPVLADVNLSETAAEICDTLRESSPDRDVRMTIEPGIHARCDGRLLAIVLTNLLENAWKFTARTPQAEITFGQEDDGTQSTYFLRDNGAGFDMAYGEKLFLPFQRLHSVEEFPGTGIGLATVARIIRAHGGKIWATSEPGKGAMFCFQLGLASNAPAPNASAPGDNDVAILARAG
jgi:signal transduction histidine kinase